MQLHHFSDSDLVSQTKMLVREETLATQKVLRYLREIEVRGIHLARGFKSLHEFCVEELGYSDGSAARRVQAMRLIRDLPETEKMLVQGGLTLETMSTLQRHFQTNKASKDQKREVLKAALHQSKRELEKTLGKPELQPVYLSAELLKKVDALKAVFGTTSIEKIFEKLVNQALRGPKPPLKTSSDPSTPAETPRPAPPAEQWIPPSFTRYRSQALNRHVIQRDLGRCTYVDPITKRRCTATRFIQFDHGFPFALGGETSVQNVHLLCANHNRFKSRHEFQKFKLTQAKRSPKLESYSTQDLTIRHQRAPQG